MLRFIFALIGSAVLAGCAATPADFPAEAHEAAQSMPAYPEGAKETPPHTVIGMVSSNSCNSSTAARFAGSQDEAIYLLKLESAQAGGNAVVGYRCSTVPVDLVSNCWASKRCKGVAAQIETGITLNP